jgi:hypothetical protein
MENLNASEALSQKMLSQPVKIQTDLTYYEEALWSSHFLQHV